MRRAKPRNAIPLSTVIVDEDSLPTSEEVEGLAASISEVGLINPISVTPDRRLLAGRHRFVACRSLGWTKIPATVVDLDAMREEILTIDENLRRRKLTVLDEAQLFARRKELYLALHPEVRPGRPKKRGQHDHVSVPSFSVDLASKTGASARTIRRVTFIGERLDPKAAELLRGHTSADRELELVRLAHLDPKSQRAAARKAAKGQATLGAAIRDEEWKSKVGAKEDDAKSDDRSRILNGDFFEVGNRYVANRSVDLVLTDPPWDKEFVPRLNDLAVLANRVLKPGHPCLVLTGQLRMPDVLDALRRELRYVWTLAYLTRESARPPSGMVQGSEWLPILFFVSRGDDRIGGRGEDVFREMGGDGPPVHPWQKDVTALREVVEDFSNAGDLVFDPFLGSGTTGVAALEVGRRFVGIDVDGDAVRLASRRLAEVEWGSGRRVAG